VSSTVKLGNAEERAKKSPSSFKIPSVQDRSRLAVGDHAKLMFMLPERSPSGIESERMWVRVNKVMSRKPALYEGVLDNKPTIIGLEFGALVEFGPEHVIDIIRPDA